MLWRQNVLLPAKSLTDDTVEILDINTKQPITAIDIEYKGTNNGTTPTAHPAKLISKIEVVDGSEILFSLSGIQLQALMYYHNKVTPLQIMSYYDNQIVVPMMRIPFGRWMWDKQLAFDPARYSNPQIKITTDLNGGGCACDAGTLEVVLHQFDQTAISPIGFLRSFEQRSYSLVASGNEDVYLERDNPIRMIMVQSLAANKQPYEQYHDLKLMEDGGNRIPFDNSVSDLLKFLSVEYPPIVESIQGYATTAGVTYYITPTYEVEVVPAGLNGNVNYFGTNTLYGGTVLIAGDTTNKYFGAIVKGYAPHGALGIFTGGRNEIGDWYDPKDLKKLTLRITAGSGILASSTCEVVLQQFKRY